MAQTLPSLLGLNEHDLKALWAIMEVADDRFSSTILVLLKEVRRLQEVNEYLRGQLHEALELNEARNHKKKLR